MAGKRTFTVRRSAREQAKTKQISDEPSNKAATAPRRRLLLQACVVAGAAVVGVALWVWYGAGKSTVRPDILLISIDTLRADRLGCYGYRSAHTPTIDGLAANAVVFDAVSSPLPITLPSHASMLTGLIPPHHGVRLNEGHRLPERIMTLAEVLRGQGYQTSAFIAGLPMVKAGGLAQGFDVYDDTLSRKTMEGLSAVARQERYAEEVLDAALAWLKFADPTRPVFAFIHIFDPHAPYEKSLPGTHVPGYDGEVAYVDRAVGSFLSALVQDARWRSALTVLTSDHGEGLGEHNEKTHGVFVYESTLHVPLIMHWPGVLSPRRVPAPVGLIDIAPTLLDLAALPPLPDEIDGQSLVRLMRGFEAQDRSLYFESLLGALNFGWAPLRGMRHGDIKYIAAPRPELYNLERDPHELTNLYAQRPRDAARLSEYLAAIGDGTREITNADQQTLAALRTLGYVSAPPTQPVEGSQRPDPKDQIEVFDRYQQAHMEFAAGRPAESLAIMEAIEPSFENSHVFYYRWGNWAAQSNNWDRAVRCYQKSLALDAESQAARLNLGVAYLKRKEPDKSLGQFKILLQLNPDHVEGHLYAGTVHAEYLGRPKDAVPHWTRFLELAPNHPQAHAIRQNLAGLTGP